MTAISAAWAAVLKGAATAPGARIHQTALNASILAGMQAAGLLQRLAPRGARMGDGSATVDARTVIYRPTAEGWAAVGNPVEANRVKAP